MKDLTLERKVLARNDDLAEENRAHLSGAGTFCVNLISSPGSGKTTLLVATLDRLRGRVRAAVVEGDVQTENDARRVEATGVPVAAIVTGGACHLDASMVRSAYRELEQGASAPHQLLVIENVGNLVCPSAYDLGEHEKVALVSVTEGEDKPLKYPALFHVASVLLVTKTDLLPHLDFDVEQLVRNARSVNPKLTVVLTSARTGEGMGEWVEYLVSRCSGQRAETRTPATTS